MRVVGPHPPPTRGGNLAFAGTVSTNPVEHAGHRRARTRCSSGFRPEALRSSSVSLSPAVLTPPGSRQRCDEEALEAADLSPEMS